MYDRIGYDVMRCSAIQCYITRQLTYNMCKIHLPWLASVFDSLKIAFQVSRQSDLSPLTTISHRSLYCCDELSRQPNNCSTVSPYLSTLLLDLSDRDKHSGLAVKDALKASIESSFLLDCTALLSLLCANLVALMASPSLELLMPSGREWLCCCCCWFSLSEA
jgi:hypothetical protein